jgi:integrase
MARALCLGKTLANPHMHRRTFAMVAMGAGVLEEIVGLFLNHTPPSITGQRYARPSLDATIRCGFWRNAGLKN